MNWLNPKEKTTAKPEGSQKPQAFLSSKTKFPSSLSQKIEDRIYATAGTGGIWAVPGVVRL